MLWGDWPGQSQTGCILRQIAMSWLDSSEVTDLIITLPCSQYQTSHLSCSWAVTVAVCCQHKRVDVLFSTYISVKSDMKTCRRNQSIRLRHARAASSGQLMDFKDATGVYCAVTIDLFVNGIDDNGWLSRNYTCRSWQWQISHLLDTVDAENVLDHWGMWHQCGIALLFTWTLAWQIYLELARFRSFVNVLSCCETNSWEMVAKGRNIDWRRA